MFNFLYSNDKSKIDELVKKLSTPTIPKVDYPKNYENEKEIKTTLLHIDSIMRDNHQKGNDCIQYIMNLLDCLETIEKNRESNIQTCLNILTEIQSRVDTNRKLGTMYDIQNKRIENDIHNLQQMEINFSKKKQFIADLIHTLSKLNGVDFESLHDLNKINKSDKLKSLLEEFNKPVKIDEFIVEKTGRFDSQLVIKIAVPILGDYHTGYKAMSEVKDFFKKTIYTYTTTDKQNEKAYKKFVNDIMRNVYRESKLLFTASKDIYQTHYNNFLRNRFDTNILTSVINTYKSRLCVIGGIVPGAGLGLASGAFGITVLAGQVITAAIIATFSIFVQARTMYKKQKNKAQKTTNDILYITFVLNTLIMVVALAHANAKQKVKVSPRTSSKGGTRRFPIQKHVSMCSNKNSKRHHTRCSTSINKQFTLHTRKLQQLRMKGGIHINSELNNEEFFKTIKTHISTFLFTTEDKLFEPLIKILQFQLTEQSSIHEKKESHIDKLTNIT